MNKRVDQLNFRRLSTLILALLLVIGIVSSCNNDEPPNPLLGTWKYISDSYTGCDDGSPDVIENYPCTASDCQKITFMNEGKLSNEFLSKGTTTTKTGTYSIENMQITICTVVCNEPVTFTVNGTTLSLIREDDAGCTVTTTLEKIN